MGLGQRYYSGGYDGGFGASVGALPSATVLIVQEQLDVGNGETREEVGVPDGIHFGVRSLDIPERDCPGPKAQFQPFNSYWVPSWRLLKGAIALP